MHTSIYFVILILYFCEFWTFVTYDPNMRTVYVPTVQYTRNVQCTYISLQLSENIAINIHIINVAEIYFGVINVKNKTLFNGENNF